MPSNPMNYPIPAGITVELSCESKAAYYQQVTITTDNSDFSCVFQGTGEDIPMLINNNQMMTNIASQGEDYNLILYFEYSTDGGRPGTFKPAHINNEPKIQHPTADITLAWVSSEDSTDNDNNDSVLRLEYWPQEAEKL
ncbi:MAG: hypothetical protein HN472_07915 [Nitrospina sp.]|jgi:hypothetical protein|nr:hypothetical protein [Nitrospina sp.]MBT3509454.1 hypothetical protein [Nitrospina sp.]MBT3876995.1 hypothetical protein [Nitrospina sp.]MBT4048810.1 hypothetical protein [Nitrospina sp.]MBT4556137.1 hypothetical protein [Nitrospina sp.]